MIEKYYYIRDPENRPFVTICLLKNLNGIGRGIAICSNKDQPCKKTGRRIAKTRAVRAVASKQHSLNINRREHNFPVASFFGAYKADFNPVLTGYERSLLFPKEKDKLYVVGKFYIPNRMMEGINRYVNEGIKPGSFLTAIIRNDLTEAVDQADDNNLSNIPAFVSYFYNETPSTCWGSFDKMNGWMQAKREEKLNESSNKV